MNQIKWHPSKTRKTGLGLPDSTGVTVTAKERAASVGSGEGHQEGQAHTYFSQYSLGTDSDIRKLPNNDFVASEK